MPFLKKLDPNAIAPYSWYLDEIKPEHGAFDPDELPVLFQTAAQLQEYCKRHKLQVPIEEYGSLEIARQHVMLAKEDPVAFKRIFDKYQETMLAERELADLNSGFIGIGRAGGEVEVDPASGKTVAKARVPVLNAKAAAPAAAANDDGDDVLS